MIAKYSNCAKLGKSYMQNLTRIYNEGFVSAPRGKEIRELIGAQIEGKIDEYQVMSFPGIRDVADPNEGVGKYLISELLWYFSGSDRAEFISLFGSMWDRIKNEDGTLNSNYGRQVFYNSTPGCKMTRYNWAVYSLRKDKDTRQAIIPYVDNRVYLPENGKDFTCTQLQHFFIRDNTLHSIVYIRSSDSIYGLNYDIPFWSIVCQIMAERLRHEEDNNSQIKKFAEEGCQLEHYPDLKLGNLVIMIGSSHLYKPHYELYEKLKAEYDKDQNKFKSLKFVPYSRFDGHNMQEAIEKLKKDLLIYQDVADNYNYSSASRLIESAKVRTDPEKDYIDLYQVRDEDAFYFAKKIMRIFRNAWYLNSNKFTAAEDPEGTAKKHFKEAMFECAKVWFDSFFEIV